MKLFILVIVLGVAGFAAYVRLAPADPAFLDVDPVKSGTAGVDGHFIVRPVGGDIAAPVFTESPAALLARFDAIVLATPRTKVVAGGLAQGRITYVTRSALWGFPDYSTVEAIPYAEGATLAIHARLRFGRGDLGVNKARVTGWLDAMGTDQ